MWYRGPNVWPTPNGPAPPSRVAPAVTLVPRIPPRLDPDCACLNSAPGRAVAAAAAISTFSGRPAPVTASDSKVAIRTDFPGGNVLVVKNEGTTIHLAADLRGGPPKSASKRPLVMVRPWQ